MREKDKNNNKQTSPINFVNLARNFGTITFVTNFATATRIKNGEIRVSTSDKGGEFTICDQTLDKAITLNHLSDSNTYMLSSRKEFENVEKEINSTWEEIFQRNFSRTSRYKRI
jgi:hypothetical protein